MHDNHRDIVYPGAIPFLLVHLACFAALWTGVAMADLALAFGLWAIRMFGVTAGYHRYFSHRSYRTNRVVQFLLAFLAESSAQRGVLWWAALHRQHHRYSDTPRDVHSPVQDSFFYSHMGWVFDARHDDDAVDLDWVKDLQQYPELNWLNRHAYFPPAVLAGIAFLIGGWSGLVVGFLWSTVVLYHTTFLINSVAHVSGKRRYTTGDESRNNVVLALVTFGEGWHNNHHYFQSSARQGFRWYEVDLTYYVLVAMSWVGLVRDLKQPPASALAGDRRISGELVERARMILTNAEASWDTFAERTMDVLAQASTTRTKVAERATEALAQVAASGNEAAERAMDNLHELAESGSHMAERAMEAMAQVAASRNELADKARDYLHQLAVSGGELADRARELLAQITDGLEPEPNPA